MAKSNYDEDYSWPGETTKTSGKPAVKTGTAVKSSGSGKTAGGSASSVGDGKYRNPERNLTKEEEKDVAIAVTSLVFAIIGLLTTVFLVGLGFSLAAFVLAIIVLKRRYYGKGFAITGLVFSILSMFGGIGLAVFLFLNIGDVIGEMTTSLLDGYVEDIGYQLEDLMYDQIYDYADEFLGEQLDDYVQRYEDYLEERSMEEEDYEDDTYEEEYYEEDDTEYEEGSEDDSGGYDINVEDIIDQIGGLEIVQ